MGTHITRADLALLKQATSKFKGAAGGDAYVRTSGTLAFVACDGPRAGARAGATKMFLTTGADNAAARSLYDSMRGGLASQGPTVNYWFLLDQ